MFTIEEITREWHVGTRVRPTLFGIRAGIPRNAKGTITAVSRTRVYVRWDGREIDDTCFECELMEDHG